MWGLPPPLAPSPPRAQASEEGAALRLFLRVASPCPSGVTAQCTSAAILWVMGWATAQAMVGVTLQLIMEAMLLAALTAPPVDRLCWATSGLTPSSSRWGRKPWRRGSTSTSWLSVSDRWEEWKLNIRCTQIHLPFYFRFFFHWYKGKQAETFLHCCPPFFEPTIWRSSSVLLQVTAVWGNRPWWTRCSSPRWAGGAPGGPAMRRSPKLWRWKQCLMVSTEGRLLFFFHSQTLIGSFVEMERINSVRPHPTYIISKQPGSCQVSFLLTLNELRPCQRLRLQQVLCVRGFDYLLNVPLMTVPCKLFLVLTLPLNNYQTSWQEATRLDN